MKTEKRLVKKEVNIVCIIIIFVVVKFQYIIIKNVLEKVYVMILSHVEKQQ